MKQKVICILWFILAILYLIPIFKWAVWLYVTFVLIQAIYFGTWIYIVKFLAVFCIVMAVLHFIHFYDAEKKF